MTIKIQGDKITFPDDSEQTTAYVGSSGGGSTPEALVWEDKTTERDWDIEYTNTNDVPLYVQIYVSMAAKGSYIQMVIDGESQGYAGNGAGGTVDGFNSLSNPLYIIPAGSKYKVAIAGADSGRIWKEARMPVAVGTGGKTVAFNSLLTSAQVIPQSLKTTIFYDDIKLDTDSNYNSSTGKYTISSDGIYRIGASVNLKKTNVLYDALAYLNINSEVVQRTFDSVKGGCCHLSISHLCTTINSLLKLEFEIRKHNVEDVHPLSHTVDYAGGGVESTPHLTNGLYKLHVIIL